MNNKEVCKEILGTFLILALVITISQILFYGPTEPTTFSAGDRVFVLNEREYGNIEDVYEFTTTVGVCYDNGKWQQHSFSDIIKLNDSRYLEIGDFLVYPLSIPGWYAESFKSYHAHPPINDIKSYCVDAYGGYKDRFTCYSETDEEIVYFSVGVVDVTIWKLQKTLDNKTNLNKHIDKTRKASQNYHNYTTINYFLLRDWLNYYGLKYNNQSVNPEDFDEIKSNTVFMNEYCSIYGYAGYDKKRGCYRVY